ncbi:MAG: HAMP domain-containing protein [Bacteroidia bacterium]|nr:HAMP domain-containing protein [Bacteroidia bacterium]
MRVVYMYNAQWNSEKTTQHIQQQVIAQEQLGYELLAELTNQSEVKNNFHKFDHLVNDDFFIHVYKNKQLYYWNTNALAPNINLNAKQNPLCIKTANGFYERIVVYTPTWDYVVYVKLYNNYPYVNSFLKNGFTKAFSPISTQAKPEINNSTTNAINSKSGQYLFSLIDNEVTTFEISTWALWIDFACLVVFLILCIALVYRNNKWSNSTKKLIVCGVIVLLRIALIYFKLPVSLYCTGLFNPSSFGSNVFFPSLGDSLLNSTIVLFCFLLTIRIIKSKTLIYVYFSLIITLLFGNYYLIELLVRDSQIAFVLFNILTVSLETFTALFLIVFNFSICVVSLQYIIKTMSYKRLIIISAIILVLSIVIAFVGISTFIIGALTLLLCVLTLQIKKQYKIYVLGLVFISNAIFITLKINQLVDVKEKNYRKTIVEKLAEEQDAIAENLILSILPKIETDSMLGVIATQKNFKGDIKKYILQKYFNGYWEKYNLQPHLFNTNGESVITENINDKKDISQYEVEMKNTALANAKSTFVFIKNKNEQNYYVAKFVLHAGKNKPSRGTLYITLKNKLLADEIGFPDLLLDNKIEAQTNLYNYNYARYQNNELVTKLGGYNYPLKSVYTSGLVGEEISNIDDNYYHYITQKPNNITVVLSKHSISYNNYLGAIIYILLLLLSTYIVVWIIYFYNEIEHLYTPSLRGRIQITFLLILIATIVLISYGTITIVKNQYQQKNETLISEKIHSVLISLEQTFGAETKLSNIDSEYLNYNLSRLANVFYTDINVFDTQGRLIASSQPKLFEQGVISSLMNNDAHTQLIEEKKTSFTQNETIGELNFLSSYLPFENNNNNVIGYINLPYFAKQNELTKEVSNYLVTLINLFLLLFIIVFIITFILANRLMAPLQEVQEKMSQLQLGIQNEHIHYSSADEIGRLVNEYNRMVDELAMSTNKLVQSEREGAWREMAKQVAHEIKNPLTPMKLSVQHLQRTFDNNDEKWKKMFENTSHNLIEQIDTLSNIATEFSNFAKLPDAHYERTDVVQIMQQVIGLYSAENNLTIRLINESENSIVLGDKDYLNRIVNNLIKNAQQAIENFEPNSTQGNILITIKNLHLTTLQITITDNGGGIPLAVQEKLFTPYFTTKSKGTGLGLAMVKKMIEQMRGEISYTTIINESTTFVLLLPLLKNNIK